MLDPIYGGITEAGVAVLAVLIAVGLLLAIIPAPALDPEVGLLRRRNVWRFLLGWPEVEAPGRGTAAVNGLIADGIFARPAPHRLGECPECATDTPVMLLAGVDVDRWVEDAVERRTLGQIATERLIADRIFDAPENAR